MQQRLNTLETLWIILHRNPVYIGGVPRVRRETRRVHIKNLPLIPDYRPNSLTLAVDKMLASVIVGNSHNDD